MDKIKELVERTKLRSAEIKDLMPINDGYTYYQSFGEAVVRAQIQKFLNDPDLALIDREKLEKGEIFVAGHTIATMEALAEVVIPLADALKGGR
ncbi:hypothetical protein LCGC14_1132770 [marine sediment metagenome]|uniref:Uncharacterized protein n=1 Tax=marine sediment metagenome TaxID=412755 RepID=A0A0F9MNG9_9ZZZZ